MTIFIAWRYEFIKDEKRKKFNDSECGREKWNRLQHFVSISLPFCFRAVRTSRKGNVMSNLSAFRAYKRHEFD
jgi:hypothetical protein